MIVLFIEVATCISPVPSISKVLDVTVKLFLTRKALDRVNFVKSGEKHVEVLEEGLRGRSCDRGTVHDGHVLNQTELQSVLSVVLVMSRASKMLQIVVLLLAPHITNRVIGATCRCTRMLSQLGVPRLASPHLAPMRAQKPVAFYKWIVLYKHSTLLSH